MTASVHRPRRLAVAAWPLAGLLGVAVAVAVLRPGLAAVPLTRIVVVQDELEPADFVFVLNGRISTRADEAARLYDAGLAPAIRLAHTREMARRPDRPLSERIAGEIVERGVPDSVVKVIPFEGGVLDTRDEARALRNHLERHPAERVIVVTTDHHTGRARRTIRQELRGLRVQIRMAPSPGGRGVTPENWWSTEEGRRVYGTELLKHLGTLVQRRTGAG